MEYNHGYFEHGFIAMNPRYISFTDARTRRQPMGKDILARLTLCVLAPLLAPQGQN